MLIEVLCVCRRPPAWVATATAEYAKRLPRELRLDFSFMAPAGSAINAAQRRQDEGARLLKRVPNGVPLIALDDGGTAHTSEAFAAQLLDLRREHRKLALVIGGADGLDNAVFARALSRWSLSRLTLPHLLIQVVLAEQIYRAWTISEGHPYHRA
jgi:23S rRNA (pseudouridine1915-N3)-methyltransferase